MPYVFTRRLLSTFFLSTPFAVVSAQQPDTATLKPVVVTATRVATPLASLPVSISVLNGADLAHAGVTSIADALRSVSGTAVVQSGSFGAQTSIFIRGGESDYTKVLLNGVPLNQPGGAFDFAGLTTDNLERVEVLRGPASVLYGSDAVAGVVQLFTRDRRLPGTPAVTLGTRGGTYGTLESYASAAGGTARLGWSVGGSWATTDGTLPFNNQSRTGAGDARLHLAPDARTDVSFSARWDDHRFHFPTDGAGRYTGVFGDSNQSTTERGSTLGLDAGRFLSSRVEGRVSVWTHHGELRYDDPQDNPGDTLGFYNDFHSRDLQDRSGADVHANVHLAARSVLTAGVGFEHEHDHSTNVCTGQFGDCSSPAIDTARTSRSLYGQALLPLGRLVDLTAGARLDHSSRFGDIVTYRGGLVLRLGRDTRLRATVGTGFKEPTFLENFSTGFVVGNPNLKLERATSGEVGIERSLLGARLAASATVFLQRFHDLIDYLGAPPIPGGPNYFNVAAANANGIETRLTAHPVGPITASLSYTFLRTRVTRSGFDSSTGAQFAAGQPLIRRPAHTARLDFEWAPTLRSSGVVSVTYVGHREDQDFNSFPAPRVPLRAYTRVDVALRGELWRNGPMPGVSLVAHVQNALNARYEEVVHFPAPRRTLLVGAELAVGR
jgi:vitamin B12 transporter